MGCNKVVAILATIANSCRMFAHESDHHRGDAGEEGKWQLAPLIGVGSVRAWPVIATLPLPMPRYGEHKAESDKMDAIHETDCVHCCFCSTL